MSNSDEGAGLHAPSPYEIMENMSELEPESSAEVEPPGKLSKGGSILIAGTDGMDTVNEGLCGSGDVGDDGEGPLDQTPG